MNYYSKELTKLNPLENLSVKFYSETDSTKTLAVNKESIDDIISFLQTYKLILPDEVSK